MDPKTRLPEIFQQLKMAFLAQEFVPRMIDAGLDAALPHVLEAFELELDERRNRRVDRLRRASRLPPGKVFAALDKQRLPAPLVSRLDELSRGDFLDRATNVLAFGLPGTGKTHVGAAIGHQLVERGRSVLFMPTYRLVQDLLAAKKEYELPRALKKLDQYELLILDDIGYVQQTEEEVEVLFTLLAERYERRSMLITSNLVFSEWERIFKNPMTTAAAIDRLVHHSVILEFNVESFRTNGPKPPADGGAKAKGVSPSGKTAQKARKGAKTAK